MHLIPYYILSLVNKTFQAESISFLIFRKFLIFLFPLATVPCIVHLFPSHARARLFLSNGIHPSSLISHVSRGHPYFSVLVLPPGHTSLPTRSPRRRSLRRVTLLYFFLLPLSTPTRRIRSIPGAPAAVDPHPRASPPTTLTFLFLLRAPSCPHHSPSSETRARRARTYTIGIGERVRECRRESKRAQPPTREGCRPSVRAHAHDRDSTLLATPSPPTRETELQRELCKLCLCFRATIG